jgi:hypothetical protein
VTAKHFFNTQWPEDFDFASTRVLNVKAPVSTVTGPYNDENTDEKESEKEPGFADIHSAVGDDGVEPDPDLDPASLNKAFRFAAWSSVALVCDLPSCL